MSLKNRIKGGNFSVETFHLNTKFRNDYYKTPSTKCTIPMKETKKFQAVRLSQICLPNSWYVFSNLLENNYFIVQMEKEGSDNMEILEIVIPEGNYTADELETYLNTTYFADSERIYGFRKIRFTINKHTLKSQFSLIDCSIESTLKFDIIFVRENTPTLMTTCGWILGFRYGKYYNIRDEIYSEGLYDGGGDRYVYFCLTNTELENAKTVHVISLDNKVESTDSTHVLSKIYLNNGKFSININEDVDNEFTFNKSLILGKDTTLTKGLDIKILDQYGQEIYLNNMDFSFTLEFINIESSSGGLEGGEIENKNDY
tara:strand:- start:511 stop:1455 length:945 start_codon:yes stop_codon:yes gene_type:complete